VSADLFQGFAACVLGAIVMVHMSELWFGHLLYVMGDPPVGNPAYHPIASAFWHLEYQAPALVVGLIAGFGRPWPWWRGGIRFLVGPVLSSAFMLDTKYYGTYIPLVFACFLLALILSMIYEWLSHRKGYAREAVGRQSQATEDN
jgi:uncharacterized membrane protein